MTARDATGKPVTSSVPVEVTGSRERAEMVCAALNAYDNARKDATESTRDESPLRNNLRVALTELRGHLAAVTVDTLTKAFSGAESEPSDLPETFHEVDRLNSTLRIARELTKG